MIFLFATLLVSLDKKFISFLLALLVKLKGARNISIELLSKSLSDHIFLS